VPDCKHHDICGRDALHGAEDDLCILHSESPKKDKNACDDPLEGHRKKNGDDCRHFFSRVILSSAKPGSPQTPTFK
jgi:hypothetical protein